jgi:multidrug efflux system outer membrane protein
VPAQLAGTLFDLAPGRTYEVELIADDPDGGGETRQVTVTTRSAPRDPALATQRPVATTAQLQAAHARVNVARAQFYPDISLTAVFGRVSTNLGDVLSSSASSVASLGPNVVLPLYSGGALQGNEEAALARLDQALIGYRRTVLGALAEVADSLSAYDSSAELIAAQSRRVIAARETLRLSDMRFRAGVVGFVEVLDAQRQVLAAETDAAQSLLERRLALGRVYLALGGGWDNPPK